MGNKPLITIRCTDTTGKLKPVSPQTLLGAVKGDNRIDTNTVIKLLIVIR